MCLAFFKNLFAKKAAPEMVAPFVAVILGGSGAVGSAATPVSDITLSANSIAENAAQGTVVGTLSNNLGISVSWAITDNSDFQLSASTGTTVTLQRSGTGTLTEGVSESVTIRATAPGASAYDENFSITVTAAGADALSGYLTITEGAASSKTNEPFQITWPMAPSELGVGQTLRIYDDNGSGAKGTVLSNFQVDGLSTSNSHERMCVISGIVPSLGSGATRKLHVDVSSTAAPTGTAITEANLFATAFRLVLTFNIGGTNYTIDTDDFEGASTTFSKTAPHREDDYMSGPGTVCFSYSAPPMNTGTAHASGDGLRVFFNFYARKAGTAAVDGGNPITVVDWDLEIHNQDITRASPANYLYGLQIQRSTSLSDGTLITTDQTDVDGNVTRMIYARSQPAVTLTATGFTSTGAKTWTRASGSWDSDILGAHITGDSGAAYVTARTNNTTIEVYVYDASASLTSLTSGNWTIEGCGHEYGRPWLISGSVGTVATSKVLWGDNTSAITPTTKAALDHLISKYAINNYGFAFSDVTHSMTNLNLMRADNAIRPFTQLGPELTLMGDVFTDVGGTGNREDIGQMPEWCVNGLAKCDANGRRKIFENARYYRGGTNYMSVRRYSGSPSAGALPTTPRVDNGTSYKMNSAYAAGSTQVNFPSVRWNPFDGDVGHAPEPFYAPFLLTGKLVWLQALQEAAFYYITISADDTYSGTGANKTPFGDASLVLQGDLPFGALQQRECAWAFRSWALAAFCTPDSDKPSIYNAKSIYDTMIANSWARLDFVKSNYTNGSGDEDHYDTSGPKWMGYRFNNNIDRAPWQTRYCDWMLVSAIELGQVASTTDDFITWFATDAVGMSQDAGVAPDYASTAYYFARCTVTGNTTKVAAVQSFADCYQAWMQWPPGYEGSPGTSFNTWPATRRPTTISLSATSGASVTVTMTGNKLGQTSWYVGGWIYETSGGSGKGVIVSVSNDNTCVIDTTATGGAAFSSTSPTASNIALPIPHPSDAGADGSVTTGRDTVYMMLYRLANVMYADRGIDTAAAVSYIEGLSNFPTLLNKLNIDPR